MRSARGIPRWLAFVLWSAQLAFFYLVLPAMLADGSPHRGWRKGRPKTGDLSGLVLLVSGLLGIVWVAYLHLVEFPRKVHVPTAAPSYLLRTGPYRWSRNPQYVAGIATWLGWAAYYGSVPVLVGACSLWAFLSLVAIPLEERALEARHGDAYLDYKAITARWLGLGRPEYKATGVEQAHRADSAR